MADLGDTSYVGFAQPLRTPAERFAAPPQDYGLHSGFPTSSFVEKEQGDVYDVFVRISVPAVVRPAPQLVWYEMRGRDQDCPTLTYRYWRVVGTPDMTGTSYAGPKCGANPLVGIVVLENDISS